MKYIFSFLLTLILFSTQAQKLDYGQGQIEYDDETVQTIQVTLDPRPELLEDKFERWMNEEYDVNLKEKTLLFFEKEFMSAKGVKIPEISERKLDLIVKVDQNENNMTELNVFASFGYNSWITPNMHPYEYAALNDIVVKFINDYLPEYYFNRLEDAKEKLSDLTKEKEDLTRDRSKNLKQIEKLRAENEKLMKQLSDNQRSIFEAESEIKMQKKKYQNIKKKVE